MPWHSCKQQVEKSSTHYFTWPNHYLTICLHSLANHRLENNYNTHHTFPSQRTWTESWFTYLKYLNPEEQNLLYSTPQKIAADWTGRELCKVGKKLWKNWRLLTPPHCANGSSRDVFSWVRLYRPCIHSPQAIHFSITTPNKVSV